jgi:antitoxin FitA
MHCTCMPVAPMPKMIQIRHVPDEVHRTLKARAAEAGMSLSDYLRQELTRMAGKPTMKQVLEQIRRRGPIATEDFDSVETIREIRGR